jgi:hypothetical protein
MCRTLERNYFTYTTFRTYIDRWSRYYNCIACDYVMENSMKRPKGLAGQMAKQMHTTKGAAKGMLVRAKKMNDEEGFRVGGVGLGKIDMNLLVDSYTGEKVYPVKRGKLQKVRGVGVAVRGNTFTMV